MEMFDNFNNISEDYIPNNMPRCCPHFKLDIMTGETASHSFDLPFNVDELLDYMVIYKMGLEVILIKDKSSLYITTEEDGTSIINCTLSEDETKLFSSTILSTSVQLKFVFSSGSVSYSDIYRVNIIDSLDYKTEVRPTPKPPVPPIIAGFGYTED